MDISETMLPYIEKAYSMVSERIRKISREGKVRKDYILTLTEVQSFLATLRDFLKRASCLEQAYKDLKVGRLCHKWLYTEEGSIRILTKLNPKLVIAFNGSEIKVTYNDREAKISGNQVEYTVNLFRDTITLENVEEVLEKKSVLINALGKLKAALQHTLNDFDLCIKELRLRC